MNTIADSLKGVIFSKDYTFFTFIALLVMYCLIAKQSAEIAKKLLENFIKVFVICNYVAENIKSSPTSKAI
jgi:uncharacterized protein YqhQ